MLAHTHHADSRAGPRMTRSMEAAPPAWEGSAMISQVQRRMPKPRQEKAPVPARRAERGCQARQPVHARGSRAPAGTQGAGWVPAPCVGQALGGQAVPGTAEWTGMWPRASVK